MRQRRSNLLRGALGVLLLLVVVVSLVVDDRLKQWPGDGLSLSDGIRVETRDWPGFWAGILKTEAGSAVSKALSREIAALERDVRFATGIRPTPLRWSLWLGNRAVFSNRGAQSVLCVRPGLLLRVCHALGLGPTDDAEKHAEFAWQEGYLLAFFGGRDAAPLTAAHPEDKDLTPDTGVSVYFPDSAGRLSLHVSAAENIPIEITGSDGISPVGEVAPVPLSEVARHAIVDLFVDARGRAALDEISKSAAHLGLLPDTKISLAPRVPDALTMSLPWDRIVLERRVLFDVQADNGETILHVGNSVCLNAQAWGRHPFETDTLYPPSARVPYDWEGVAGFYLPIRGNDYTFGCAIQGAWAHTANPPTYLPELLVDAGTQPDVPPSFRLRVNWPNVATTFATWYRATYGNAPGTSEAFALERALTTWGDALRALGETRLEMQRATGDGRWRIGGQLARGIG